MNHDKLREKIILALDVALVVAAVLTVMALAEIGAAR
jgi:hypothetical protein